MLGDQIVQGREQRPVRSVRPDDERRGRAGGVLFGDIHSHSASVGSGVAGGDDQLGGVGWIWRAKSAGLARYTGVDLAGSRFHGEGVDRSLRHALLRGHLRREVMCRAEDEVSVGVYRSVGAVR